MNFWVRFLLKPPKLQFWAVFGIFWVLLNRRNFLQDRASSFFLLYGYLTSCKKSEKKFDEPILISWLRPDRRTENTSSLEGVRKMLL